MNIITYINKSEETEAMKNIIFSSDQLKIFNYLKNHYSFRLEGNEQNKENKQEKTEEFITKFFKEKKKEINFHYHFKENLSPYFL